MPYLVGDLIKEITAGGPVPSFPKSFKGPPKLEKEKDALALDEKKSQLAQENRAAKVQEEPTQDTHVQGRHKAAAASKHMGIRHMPVAQPDPEQKQEEKVVKLSLIHI